MESKLRGLVEKLKQLGRPLSVASDWDSGYQHGVLFAADDLAAVLDEDRWEPTCGGIYVADSCWVMTSRGVFLVVGKGNLPLDATHWRPLHRPEPPKREEER